HRLAQHLVGLGVGPGVVVGVCLERGPELVEAVLAVLKAGAGYTLLDPDFPVERLVAALAETGAPVVVTTGGLGGRLAGVDARFVRVDVDASVIAACPVGAVVNTAGPGDVACVMFTSGSTGRPKGVAAPHRAIVGTLCGQGFVA